MKPTLILAEDQVQLREQLHCELIEDFEVLEACENGQEAIDAIIRHEPDLALLDIVMPQRTGIEVIREIKKRTLVTKCPRFVILSGIQHPQKVAEAFEAGVTDYLFKPHDIEKLIRVLFAVYRDTFSRSKEAYSRTPK